MKTKNIKIIIISALIISMLAIGVGFAAFSTILSIDGTASISSGTWNIYFSDIERDDANSTSGIGTTLPEIGDNENAGSNTIDTKIDSFDVTFTEPNQKVVYIATVTNGGTYNAKLTVKNVGTPSCSGTGDNAETDASNVCSNLTYTVTGPEVDSTLSAGSSATYTITIQYNDISDASLLPKASVSITIPSSTFTYTQDSSSSGTGDSGGSSSTTAIQTLTNLGLSVDTEHTPDFSTCSGNSCSYLKSKYVTSETIAENQGDGTNGIYSATDDLGTSYYFRGAVTNNYVSFANKTWRIVRINGDGTIRIALNESAGTTVYNTNYNDNAYVGYMYGTTGASTYEATHANTNDSDIKKFLDNWYEDNLNSYSSYIADSIFCNDRSVSSSYPTGTGIGTTPTVYGARQRNNIDFTASLVCPQDNDKFTVESTLGNGNLTYPIGLLTADEYLMAGAGPYDFSNSKYYSWATNSGAFYLYDADNKYWTISSSSSGGYAYVTGMFNLGYISYSLVNNSNGAVRPVVSLKSDAITGGTGTSSDPFVVGQK